LNQSLLRPSSLGLCIALSLGLSLGCRQLPKEPGAGVQVISSSGLAELNPNDVVVAPVQNTMEQGGMPAENIRQAFYSALPRRGYAPLALEFVDRAVVDASYSPSVLREDAVLQILVHDWNEALWDARTALTVDLEARMLASSLPGAPVVWSGRLQGRYEFERDERQFASDEALLQHACDELAGEILSAMPARSTVPGRN
jgi:hypothetical protein